MRTVATDISNFGLVIGDTVTLQLIDSVGNVCVPPFTYTLDETITLTTDTFSKALTENALIPMTTYYRLTLPDESQYIFTVPRSPDGTDTVYDLSALVRIGCFKDVINHSTGAIDDRFLERFEDYLTGGPSDFDGVEMNVVGLYTFYADNVFGTGRTADAMQKLDEYLGGLGE